MSTRPQEIVQRRLQPRARWTTLALRWGGELLAQGVIAVFGFVLALPFLWMLSTSLKPEGREFVYPPEWLPNPMRWDNYLTALTALPFGLYFFNTLVITLSALAGTLLTASLAAFAFARLRFPGREFLFLLVISTLMLPGIVTLIPRFILFRHLGWIDTFLPLIVPWWFGGGAFNIFLIRQFFMTLPFDLDDAARIDGASNFQIYWRVLLPLAKPALATVAVLGFLHHWNDFLEPLIYLQSPNNRTVALGLRGFQDLYHTQWTLMMAAAATAIFPVLVLFFVAQRYFVRGIHLTGLAGR